MLLSVFADSVTAFVKETVLGLVALYSLNGAVSEARLACDCRVQPLQQKYASTSRFSLGFMLFTSLGSNAKKCRVDAYS